MFLFYIFITAVVFFLIGRFFSEIKKTKISETIFSERDRLAKKIGDKMLKIRGL